MITLTFSILNPFSNRFANIFCKYKRLSKHKCAELELLRDSGIISFSFIITTKQDHSGFYIAFGLLSWNISFAIYDIRHWDYKTNKWEVYDNETNH